MISATCTAQLVAVSGRTQPFVPLSLGLTLIGGASDRSTLLGPYSTIPGPGLAGPETAGLENPRPERGGGGCIRPNSKRRGSRKLRGDASSGVCRKRRASSASPLVSRRRARRRNDTISHRGHHAPAMGLAGTDPSDMPKWRAKKRGELASFDPTAADLVDRTIAKGEDHSLYRDVLQPDAAL